MSFQIFANNTSYILISRQFATLKMFNNAVNIKRYPHYWPWRPTGDVDARVHIFTATVLGRGGRLVLRSAAFTPGKAPGTHFIGGLSGPQDQSGHLGSNLGRPAHSSAPCRLSHLAHAVNITVRKLLPVTIPNFEICLRRRWQDNTQHDTHQNHYNSLTHVVMGENRFHLSV